ncbi:hypothetical protein GQ457_06G032630 [Hibiscus cannabinus]
MISNFFQRSIKNEKDGGNWRCFKCSFDGIISLLLSTPKHHQLLFFACDFVVVVKSSPLAGFIMFNVITSVIIGSPKPKPCDHQDAAGRSDEFISSVPAFEYVNQVYRGYDDFLGTNDDEDSEKDEEDNDLERRIEEVIVKVTRR